MKRDIWEELIQWKSQKDRKPLILRGARQVGKTYILKAFGEKCFQKYHYINCESHSRLSVIFDEDKDVKRIINELSFFLNEEIDLEHDLVIFDEIQSIPRIIATLKYFQETIPQLAVCAAGSLLGVHLNEISFPVGKVSFMDIYPMSFVEFLQGIGEGRLVEFWRQYDFSGKVPEIVHDAFWQKFKWYCVTGGLPDIVGRFASSRDNLFEAMTDIRARQKELIYAYNADMAKHSGQENAMHIQRLWENIPAQLAREQGVGSSRFKFRGVIPLKNRYAQLSGTIDWLNATGLLIKVYVSNNAELPFSAYISENIFKLYVFDVGILGALSDLPPATVLKYDYGTYKGFYAENFAAQEMVSSGSGQLYSWKGRTSEIEFVREFRGHRVPVEVKAGAVKHSRSLAVFSKKYQQTYKIILSGLNFSKKEKDGVYKCPLYFAGKLGDLIKE